MINKPGVERLRGVSLRYARPSLSFCVAILLWSCWLRDPAEAAPLFQAGFLSYDAGNNPQSVAIGDLNADGRPDLAVANYDFGASTVSVLLGNGDGTFGSKTDFATGDNPVSVAIGDLNGDGRPDLAVANSGFPATNTVSVLLGNGDGTFGSNTDFGTGSEPSSVAIGDLNGDGRPDLAVANEQPPSTVSVLLGNGDGSFGTKTDFGTGASPHSVAIGDLNADGRPDLAVANYGTGTVSVLLGNGAGAFGAKTDFGTDSFPLSVAIGDLNGDGRPDLAVANSSAGTVSVLLGNGDGTFGSKTDFGAGGGSSSVTIGDLNGDRRPDLAVANSVVSTVSVLLGNGDGTFGAHTDFGTGGGGSPQSVVIGDLNGDTRPDLAVANAGSATPSNTVSVLLGNGDGTFGAHTDFGTGGGSHSVAIGDLNGDRRPDLAVANTDANTVSVLLGNGDGTFGSKTDFGTGDGPSSVAIGYLNNDGWPDLAVANSNGQTVSVLLLDVRATPVFLSSFALMRGDNGIEVRWALSSHAGATDFRLTASRGPADQWEIPIDEQAGSAFAAWDRSPQLAAGGVVHYTLLYRDAGQGWVVLAEQTLSLDDAPRITRLLAPYPNPANPRVVIPFVLARPQHVRVTVHDVGGHEVAHLDGGEFGAGAGQVVWSGTDTRGKSVASGMYVVRLATRDGAQTRKIVVAR